MALIIKQCACHVPEFPRRQPIGICSDLGRPADRVSLPRSPDRAHALACTPPEAGTFRLVSTVNLLRWIRSAAGSLRDTRSSRSDIAAPGAITPDHTSGMLSVPGDVGVSCVRRPRVSNMNNLVPILRIASRKRDRVATLEVIDTTAERHQQQESGGRLEPEPNL
jgi:hypothetical protein